MKRKILTIKPTTGFIPVYDGESIETKVERVVQNKEPIEDGDFKLVLPVTEITRSKTQSMLRLMGERLKYRRSTRLIRALVMS